MRGVSATRRSASHAQGSEIEVAVKGECQAHAGTDCHPRDRVDHLRRGSGGQQGERCEQNPAGIHESGQTPFSGGNGWPEVLWR